MTKTGIYRGVCYYSCDVRYYINGNPQAGDFWSLSELKRYIDNNTWLCPRNVGG